MPALRLHALDSNRPAVRQALRRVPPTVGYEAMTPRDGSHAPQGDASEEAREIAAQLMGQHACADYENHKWDGSLGSHMVIHWEGLRDAFAAALAKARPKGYDDLVQRLYENRATLLPNPDYDQDIAYIAHSIDSWRKEAIKRSNELDEALKVEHLVKQERDDLKKRVEKLGREGQEAIDDNIREIEHLESQLQSVTEALREIRRLLRMNWSDNPQWRSGNEHTWTGQADIIAEAALARIAPEGNRG